MRRIAVGGLVVLAAAGVVVASRSSGPGGVAVFESAAAAAQGAETVRFEMDITTSVRDGTLSTSSSGVVNLVTGDADMRVRNPLPEGGEFITLWRVVDGQGYHRTVVGPDNAETEELANDTWVRLGAASTGENLFGGLNGAALLELLEAADDVQKHENEDVRGTPATRYEADVPGLAFEAFNRGWPTERLERYYRATDQEGQLDELRSSTLPVTVWIDGEGLLRRLTVTQTNMVAPGDDASFEHTADLVILEYGVPVDVSAPPPDETVSADEIEPPGDADGVDPAPGPAATMAHPGGLPDAYPADLPLPAGSRLVDATQADDGVLRARFAVTPPDGDAKTYVDAIRSLYDGIALRTGDWRSHSTSGRGSAGGAVERESATIELSNDEWAAHVEASWETDETTVDLTIRLTPF